VDGRHDRAGPRQRLLVAAAVGACLLATSAAAVGGTGPDFGTIGLDAKSYGARVSLSTPSAKLFVAPDEFIVHRDTVQSSLQDANAGLIQAGLYRSGSALSLDNCGPRDDYVEFVEVMTLHSMAYRCQLFNSVAPGTVLTLDVFRFHAADTWGVRINGTPTGSIYPLGFAKGLPAIGSEIEDIDADYTTVARTRFNVAGHTQWTVYRAPARSAPRRVTGRTHAYPLTDHFWKLPRPPGPITIRHR
jgi:hypothetical protein